jgi:hypothetical protein
MFIQTQTLEYREHADEIILIGKVLDLLETNKLTEAKRLLVAYHDQMIMDQTPVVKLYDQRVHS